MRQLHISFSLVGIVLLAAACTPTLPSRDRSDLNISEGGLVGEIQLFDAVTAIQDRWEDLMLPKRKRTQYRLTFHDGRIAIGATGRESASGLFRWVEVDPQKCPVLEWLWYVKQLQSDADLHDKEKEDVAASIFLLFGDPGFISNPNPVPTLRYVWTTDRHPVDTIIDNPYLPGIVRSIVVESGTRNVGRWVRERRNVVEDFTKAFGYPPEENIHAITLFTDNDQTKQEVEAYYGWARVTCNVYTTVIAPFQD